MQNAKLKIIYGSKLPIWALPYVAYVVGGKSRVSCSFLPTPIENETLGEACSYVHILNITVGMVRLQLESGNYYVQHFKRCSY